MKRVGAADSPPPRWMRRPHRADVRSLASACMRFMRLPPLAMDASMWWRGTEPALTLAQTISPERALLSLPKPVLWSYSLSKARSYAMIPSQEELSSCPIAQNAVPGTPMISACAGAAKPRFPNQPLRSSAVPPSSGACRSGPGWSWPSCWPSRSLASAAACRIWRGDASRSILRYRRRICSWNALSFRPPRNSRLFPFFCLPPPRISHSVPGRLSQTDKNGHGRSAAAPCMMKRQRSSMGGTPCLR